MNEPKPARRPNPTAPRRTRLGVPLALPVPDQTGAEHWQSQWHPSEPNGTLGKRAERTQSRRTKPIAPSEPNRAERSQWQLRQRSQDDRVATGASRPLETCEARADRSQR
jgi:hypothetical protein